MERRDFLKFSALMLGSGDEALAQATSVLLGTVPPAQPLGAASGLTGSFAALDAALGQFDELINWYSPLKTAPEKTLNVAVVDKMSKLIHTQLGSLKQIQAVVDVVSGGRPERWEQIRQGLREATAAKRNILADEIVSLAKLYEADAPRIRVQIADEEERQDFDEYEIPNIRGLIANHENFKAGKITHRHRFIEPETLNFTLQQAKDEWCDLMENGKRDGFLPSDL